MVTQTATNFILATSDKNHCSNRQRKYTDSAIDATDDIHATGGEVHDNESEQTSQRML